MSLRLGDVPTVTIDRTGSNAKAVPSLRQVRAGYGLTVGLLVHITYFFLPLMDLVLQTLGLHLFFIYFIY